MNINPLDNRPPQRTEPAKKSVEGKETFEAALNSQIKNNLPSIPGQPGKAVSIGVNPFSEIARGEFLRADSVKKAEGLLFSLEMYKNSLANTDIEEERLSGLLTDMREKSIEALRSGQGLPADDPLRGILTEVRALISNESRRFYSSPD